MKKLNILIFLFYNLICFSQEFKIPIFELKQKRETDNPNLKLLNIEDKNSLIINIGYSSYWYNGTIAKSLVYQNNGKVLLFEVFYPNDSLKKIKVRKKNIKKKNIKKVWEFLNHCSKDNRFNIDGSKLNITRIEDSEGILKYSSRSDAVNNIIEICQNENYTFLESYDPEYCIEQKQSEFEERQKFVNLITEIEKLIK